MKNQKLIIGIIVILFIVCLVGYIVINNSEIKNEKPGDNDDIVFDNITVEIINRVNSSVTVFLWRDNIELEPFIIDGDSITNTTVNKTAENHEIIVQYELNGEKSMSMTNFNVDEYLQIIFEENGGIGGYNWKKE